MNENGNVLVLDSLLLTPDKRYMLNRQNMFESFDVHLQFIKRVKISVNVRET